MKKLITLITIIALGFMSYQVFAVERNLSSSPSKIIIAFSTRAYWDGTTQGCLPQEKGWCLHISFSTLLIDGQIIGEVNNSVSSGLVFSFNQKTGITKKTFEEFFKNGKLNLDGPGTISEEILKMLQLPANYFIPAGNYSYEVRGETISISFN